MSIDRIILFISTFSKACQPCVQYIRERKLRIDIVRLDTTESRAMVKGKINHVPTMMITYGDGSAQLFINSDKIIHTLKTLFSKSGANSGRYTAMNSHHDGGNMYEKYHTVASKQKLTARPNIPRSRVNETEDYNEFEEDDHDDEYSSSSYSTRHPASSDDYVNSESHVTPSVVRTKGNFTDGNMIVYEDDEIEDNVKETEVYISSPEGESDNVNEIAKPLSKKSKVKAKAKSKTKKMKPPVVFDEDEIGENEEIHIDTEDQIEGSNRHDNRIDSKKPPSKMQFLIDKAKELERDRKQSLGYNEEDLSRYG